MGTVLLYGGLAGMGISVLLAVILIPVFRGQRKRLQKKIESAE